MKALKGCQAFSYFSRAVALFFASGGQGEKREEWSGKNLIYRILKKRCSDIIIETE